MKYLAFDIEAANGYKHYSICSVGIVIADENFNILLRENIWVNPKTKYDLDGTRKNVGINLNLDVALLNSSPDFAHAYSKIRHYLTGDYVILGHAVESDCIMLNAACKHYKLPCINFDFICSQLLYKLFNGDKEVKALSKIADSMGVTFNQHNSEEDAYISMLTLKHITEKSGLTVEELLEKYAVRKGGNRDFLLTRTVSLLENQSKRKVTNKSLFALTNYISQASFKRVSNIYEGKTFSLARSIELSPLEEIKPLIDAIYALGGKYQPKLTKSNVFISAKTLRAVDKSRDMKVNEMEENKKIVKMSPQELMAKQDDCVMWQEKIKDFLIKHRQHEQNIDGDKAFDDFAKDIAKGLKGEKSSLAMIPTYLTPEIEIIKNKPNILIDAGGTNFRCCVGSFDDSGKPSFSLMRKDIMPGVKSEVGKEEFYARIASCVKPLLDKGENIGFCFSYEVAMNPDLDGRACKFSKEIKASQVAGTLVGQSTLQALYKYDAKKRKIVILNDTVAALLGGMGITDTANYSRYVGYIYGTGTNVSYIEDNADIKKVKGLKKGKMIINTETGNFDKLTRGDFDEAVDNASMRKGEQLAEKMSSGRYISLVFKEALRAAVAEGVFTPLIPLEERFFSAQSQPQYIDTAVISKFLSGDGAALARFSPYFSQKDLLGVRALALQLIDRAAKVGALLVGAFALKGRQSGDDKPVGVVVEGTTFFKLYGFRERFEKHLAEMLGKRKVKYTLISGQELNMVGTLVASMVL